jgi:hypothetical protein
MAEPLRIAGNVVAIAAVLIVLLANVKSYAPHILGGAAIVVVVLNGIHAAGHGYFAAEHAYIIPTLVFIGIALFLLLRWAQVKWLESSAAIDKPGAPFYLRWWMALIAALVGIGIVSLGGPQVHLGPTVDVGTRWLDTAIEELNAAEEISADERESVRNYLQTLIDNPENRLDEAGNAEFVGTLKSQEAVEIVECAFVRVSSPINYQEGYWVAEVEVEGVPFPVEMHNDIHIDACTMRVTVYGQVRMLGTIIAPVQAGPDEVAEHFSGNMLGMHPNAVYLNGSGEELAEADGTGTWWVDHPIMGPEGYYNWTALISDYSFGGQYTEGYMLEDGVTMFLRSFVEGDEIRGFPVDPEAVAEESYGNSRAPGFETDAITHIVTRWEPANIDPEAGPIDYTSTATSAVVFECRVEPSAFDGLARACPTKGNHLLP